MADNIAGDELRQIIERLERLEAEKQDALDAIKDALTDAKGRGYSAPILRTILARRKKNPDDVAEADALLDLYESNLGA